MTQSSPSAVDPRSRLVLHEQARHIHGLMESLALFLLRHGHALEPEWRLAQVAESQLQDLVDELGP